MNNEKDNQVISRIYQKEIYQIGRTVHFYFLYTVAVQTKTMIIIFTIDLLTQTKFQILNIKSDPLETQVSR